CMQFLEFPLTF
nr:immunoglobulin light chain junction region [Macaca mulatta]